jgi:lysophospholipase L1-like esterase
MIEYNTAFEIRVNGIPVQDTQFKFGATGGARVVQVDFAGVAKDRKIELFGRLMPFGGVWVASADTVSYPSEDDAVPLIAFAPGDSYTQGTGAASPRQTYAGAAADALGLDFWSEGIGSSGWLSSGANLAATRIQQYVAPLSKAPSIVVTPLGFNDAGGDLTLVATNYDAAVAQIRAAWPAAAIVTLGPWTPKGATTVHLTAIKQVLMDRAAANGVLFIDIEGIITLGNMAQYTGSDLTHPTAEGHRYLGAKIAERMRTAGL